MSPQPNSGREGRGAWGVEYSQKSGPTEQNIGRGERGGVGGGEGEGVRVINGNLLQAPELVRSIFKHGLKDADAAPMGWVLERVSETVFLYSKNTK